MYQTEGSSLIRPSHSPAPLRLGLLTHAAGDGDPARLLRETIELFVIAEQLGFHSAWIAQHHVRAENGHVPSPFVFLAAAAERTSRIRLGTGIVMLPLEDPIRVAEDAAVADLLSGGRLELGLGTGVDPISYMALGSGFETRRARHTEHRSRLHGWLRGQPTAAKVPVHPQAPGLADRIWWATGSDDSACEAGAEGHGILLGRAAPRTGEPVDRMQLRLIETYRSRLGPASAPPRIGVTRSIYPAGTRAEAIRILEAGTRSWLERMIGDGPWRALDANGLFALHNIHCGPAEAIIEGLAADRALRHATDLLVQVQPGEPSFAETVRALTTIALEIVPAVRRTRLNID